MILILDNETQQWSHSLIINEYILLSTCHWNELPTWRKTYEVDDDFPNVLSHTLLYHCQTRAYIALCCMYTTSLLVSQASSYLCARLLLLRKDSLWLCNISNRKVGAGAETSSLHHRSAAAAPFWKLLKDSTWLFPHQTRDIRISRSMLIAVGTTCHSNAILP